MLRVVIDTNVFVSALISKKPSPPFHIYNIIRSDRLILITSNAILKEFDDVFNREEIAKLHKFSHEKIQTILQEVREKSFIVSETMPLHVIKNDPDDDKFLVAAIEGNADYIVSGDHHLLDLKKYEGISILSPKDFVDLLQ